MKLRIDRAGRHHVGLAADGIGLAGRVGVFLPAAGIVDQNRDGSELGLHLGEQLGRHFSIGQIGLDCDGAPSQPDDRFGRFGTVAGSSAVVVV